MEQALISPFCAGIMLGTTTILSVGPVNLMMFREGLVQRRIGRVTIAVWISDLALLAAAAITTGSPLHDLNSSTRTLLLSFSVVLFGSLAARSFFDACRSNQANENGSMMENWQWFSLIWMNPLTYLELFLAPTAISQIYSGWSRANFFCGMFLMTTICCFLYLTLGCYASRSTILRRNARILDASSGCVLTAAACMTAIPLLP